MELLWQDGAVVAHSQAAQRAFAGAGNTGASGVTGEAAAAAWLPGGGALGGDVYSQLWQSIALAQADGRVGAPARARPPAQSGNSAAGSSRTAGEVGSSFCGSNLVAAARHLDDDIDDVAALPPPPPPGTSRARAGARPRPAAGTAMRCSRGAGTSSISAARLPS